MFEPPPFFLPPPPPPIGSARYVDSYAKQEFSGYKAIYLGGTVLKLCQKRGDHGCMASQSSHLSDNKDLLCIDIKSVCAYGKLLHILIKCPFCVKECNDFCLHGIFF